MGRYPLNYTVTSAAQATTESKAMPTAEQQHAVNQFQHQAAQQKPHEQHDIKINSNIDSFMIDTVNMTSLSKPDGTQGIGLSFIAKDEQQNINLTLTIEQFHVMLATMIEKAANWDLVNPWLDNRATVSNTVIPDAGVMH